jgi:hypothetical protein
MINSKGLDRKRLCPNARWTLWVSLEGLRKNKISVSMPSRRRSQDLHALFPTGILCKKNIDFIVTLNFKIHQYGRAEPRIMLDIYSASRA